MGDVVRKLREAKGWKQKDLSDRADIAVTAVVRLERSGENSDQRTIYRAAQALGVSVADLYALAEPVTMTTQQREAWNLWLSLKPHQQDSLMQTAKLMEAQNLTAPDPHSAAPGAPATAHSESIPKVRKA